MITREFDAAGRIRKILEGTSGPEIANFGYAGKGLRLLNKTYMNGNYISYGYDSVRRLTEIFARKVSGGDLLEKYIYGYNKVGMKMFERRTHESDTGEQYAYDPAYRLTRVKKGVPGANINDADTSSYTKKNEYRLDSVENIVKIITEQGGNVTEKLTQMATANARKLHQYTDFDGIALTYDANGNTTQKGNQNFSYNFRNQLVQVTESGQPTVNFKYDALGRRIEKSSSGNTEKYYYAGSQVIETRNGSDQVIKQFIYGNGIDEPVRFDRNESGSMIPYYFHLNQIGSITALTDSNGNVVERIKYDDYGKPTFTDYKTDPNNPTERTYSIIGNNVLFQGREWEPDLNIRKRSINPIFPGCEFCGRLIS